jgi:hypothetical protein
MARTFGVIVFLAFFSFIAATSDHRMKRDIFSNLFGLNSTKVHSIDGLNVSSSTTGAGGDLIHSSTTGYVYPMEGLELSKPASNETTIIPSTMFGLNTSSSNSSESLAFNSSTASPLSRPRRGAYQGNYNSGYNYQPAYVKPSCVYTTPSTTTQASILCIVGGKVVHILNSNSCPSNTTTTTTTEHPKLDLHKPLENLTLKPLELSTLKPLEIPNIFKLPALH